jgi:hypothetical protein
MLRKTLFIIIATLLNLCCAKAQDNWMKFKVDEFVAVKFPARPIKKSAKSYIYASKDSSILLMCEIHSEGDEDADEPPFTEFMPKTAQNEKDMSANLTEFNTGTWNGYNTTSSTLVTPVKRFTIYTIFIGGRAYMLGALLSKNIDSKVAKAFFSSVMIEK